MPYYKFGQNDIFHNRIETYPEASFILYDNQVFYKNTGEVTGAFTTNVGHVPVGYISLYELNVDLPSGQLIYPFITKDGSLTSFSTTTTSKFNSDFTFGETITGSYPLSASITSTRYATGASRPKIKALRNALDSYKILNSDYAYSSSVGNKETQELRLISIPSIFYGSSIKKGSVSLKFYVSGSEIAELKDDKKNGQLRQVTSGSTADSGSVAGVVMYDQGFVILTGSWDLADHTEGYYNHPTLTKPRWIDFGTLNQYTTGSAFKMEFSGTNYVPVTTMMAHAPRGELNYSSNPTFVKYGENIGGTTSSAPNVYIESDGVSMANVVSSSYAGVDASFQKTTFINYVGIYDESKNLIAIAKLANPVRKREEDDFTFKLKLDF
tara:strand:+ start:3487 stop:4632 length:1146 start_codon:yes stop_codon:yes gene_type:complete